MLTETAVRLFLAHCGAKGLSPNTVKWYKQTLEPFAAGHKNLPASSDVIDDFLAACQAGDERRHGHFRVLRVFYRWMHKKHHTKNVFADGMVDAPRRTTKSPRYLSPDDLDNLLSFPHSSAIKAYLMLLIDSGCRIGELYNLKVEDFEESAWGLTVRVHGKTGERVIPISQNAFTAIKPYLPIPYSLFWLRRLISRAFKDAHVLGTAHTLRHTFGTLWAGDEMVLQRILGHSKISTTQIYRHLATKRLSEQHNQFSPLKMVFSRTRSML